MNYTQRFCHLASEPDNHIGSTVIYGDKIGYMGDSGDSHGAHLHTDGIEGHHGHVWRLSDMEHGSVVPAPKQCAYFIDGGLFGYSAEFRESYQGEPIEISTYYADPRYLARFGKLHLGYDLYPIDSAHWGITWNRSKPGTVLSKGFDPGYGYYINIGYEA